MVAVGRVESRVLMMVFATGLCALLLVGDGVQPRPAPKTPARPAALGRPVRAGKLEHPALRESSGIVASRKHPGVFWTMNDSGNPRRLFAVDATGKSLRTVKLKGAANVDWEDIAADAHGKLYVADVGDNSRRRRSLTIYVLSEPDPRAADADAVAVERTTRFRYPRGHGPFDCEAMFVHAGQAYLVTKEPLAGRLYRVRLDAPAGRLVEAESLGLLPEASRVTGADLSPDGRQIALVANTGIFVYDLPRPLPEELADARDADDRPINAVRVPPRRRRAILGQAEGICWTLKPLPGDLLITNEQRRIFRLRSPGDAAPTSSPRPGPGEQPSQTGHTQQPTGQE